MVESGLQPLFGQQPLLVHRCSYELTVVNDAILIDVDSGHNAFDLKFGGHLPHISGETG